MKILIDTNVLISALIKPDGKPNRALRAISTSDKYDIFLTDQNIAELRSVVIAKMPRYNQFVDPFLAQLDFEVVAAVVNTGTTDIRDASDQPILNAAILNDLDVILTGDKDFLSVQLDHPKCMSVADFCEQEHL